MSKMGFSSLVFRNLKINGSSSMKEICESLMRENVEDSETGRKLNAKLALCIKMYEHALRGDSKYMTILMGILGEMPMSESDKTVIVPMLVNNIPNAAQ